MRLGSRYALALLLALSAGCVGLGAAAQENASEEAARRQSALASLPQDAAKRIFGVESGPAALPPAPIGAYSKGCLAGGTALPADGPNWQVMRPSRNRAWGHPVLIAFIERLAARMPSVNGWPGLLVGDIAQPRGGPMLTGHASHQIGLDADIWLRPMPERRLSRIERDEISAVNVVAADGEAIDPTRWTLQHRQLLEAVSRSPEVARIFVNPAIKRALCREAGPDRSWLTKIRPTWGHNYHFHIRLLCPPGQGACEPQTPPGPGDGCGADLDWWFSYEARHPKPSKPERPLRLADLPAACVAVATAPAR